jgi:hypothetical protein
MVWKPADGGDAISAEAWSDDAVAAGEAQVEPSAEGPAAESDAEDAAAVADAETLEEAPPYQEQDSPS